MMTEIEVSKTESSCEVKICGYINEDTKFPDIDSVQGELKIDFIQVQAINSTGIRLWLGWVKSLKAQSYKAINIAPSIVKQCNMVLDFIPSHFQVDSFFVPYYCADDDSEEMELYKRGEQFQIDGDTAKVQVLVTKTISDKEFEIDVVAETYFNFLAKNIELDQQESGKT